MQHILRRKKLKKLKNLSKKYNFKYGFVNDFNTKFEYDTDKLSKIYAVGTNPKEVLETCQTVMVLAFQYKSDLKTRSIASISYGINYHLRINEILEEIIELFPGSIGIVDGSVLNEKYFANKSGLGYVGKNSLFISKEYGSFCNLALVLIPEKIEHNNIECNISCGTCTRCIDACPTQAIGKQLDCNKCISEKLQTRNNLDFEGTGTSAYGCDICQNVCPHNQNKVTVVTNDFNDIDLKANLFLTKREFNEQYSKRGFHWIGYRTFLRNVHIAYINTYHDYSKIEFLKASNSEYLQQVYDKIMEDKNG